MKMVCFVSSRTLRKKHIVTCFFLPKGKRDVTRWTKQAFPCSKFLSPGGQLWANTALEGSQFYSIGVPKFYSWVNVISVYEYNDLG